jgi:hypothetical protein
MGYKELLQQLENQHTQLNVDFTFTIDECYEKLEYIHFAIQEAMVIIQDQDNPELKQALEFVEDLREPFLN